MGMLKDALEQKLSPALTIQKSPTGRAAVTSSVGKPNVPDKTAVPGKGVTLAEFTPNAVNSANTAGETQAPGLQSKPSNLKSGEWLKPVQTGI